LTSKYFLSLFTLILLLLSSSAWGQDGDYPRVEVFGGFSWIEIDVEGGEDERFNGWQASISGNFNENIGIVVDAGGRYRSFVDITTQSYEFLVGPRFTMRIEDGSLFVHALAGLNHARISGLGDTLSDTAFAMGFGGGVDISVGDWGAIRMLQVDYIGTRISGLDEWDWNLRTGIGFVFKFGY
jgi:hypothetical protein